MQGRDSDLLTRAECNVLRGIARGRDIGIISHVGRLKGQIAERITVAATIR